MFVYLDPTEKVFFRSLFRISFIIEWVSGLGLWFALCCSRCAVKGDLLRGGRVVARWQIEASSWGGWGTYGNYLF